MDRYVTVVTDEGIRSKTISPQTERGAAFLFLKGGVSREPRPKKVRVSWISQETWKLADRRAALQRAHRASVRAVRQAQRSLQRALRVDRQIQVR